MGLGLGPGSGLGHLLGTWLLHALVTDPAEGHSICPKPEATWTWDREECSPQPSPPLCIWGEKKCIGEEPRAGAVGSP